MLAAGGMRPFGEKFDIQLGCRARRLGLGSLLQGATQDEIARLKHKRNNRGVLGVFELGGELGFELGREQVDVGVG